MSAQSSKQVQSELKDIEGFDQEDLDGFRTAFNKSGLSELKNKVEESINKWKKIPVNIAITGESGVGKSSFINSFRGLKAGQQGVAGVGVSETTKEPTKYVHPINDYIALWDLPGVGTPKFPKETYLEKVNFHKYDYFIIITASRFKENDLWLAKVVRDLRKDFFFVRTKMEDDVRNNKRDKDACKADTIKEVRESILTLARTEGLKENEKVYLVDNYSPLEYDMPILIDDMIKRVPKLKQDAITFSMTNLTEQIIIRKRDALHNRIMKVSLLSAVGGAIPIPGVSLAIDAEIINKECLFYREQFGLDDVSLQKNADELGITLERLIAVHHLSSHALGVSVKSTLNFIGTLVVSEAAERLTSMILPIIGIIISGAISYGSTVSVLKSILNVFVTDALAINKLLMERLLTSSLV